MSIPEEVLIEVQRVSLKAGGKPILKDISLIIKKREAWAITGPTGSGKTSLGKLLGGLAVQSEGQLDFHPSIASRRAFISQQHDFLHLTGGGRAYYQQRFDSNYNSASPVMQELLEQAAIASGTSQEQMNKIIHDLQMTNFLQRRLIELSNGEGKRLQLALALLKQPNLLVLDNPFLGLDTNARASLHEIINELFHQGILMVIISPEHELPLCVSHMATLDKGQLMYAGELKHSLKAQQTLIPTNLNLENFQSLFSLAEEDFKVAVEMVNVSVSYGDKVVLEKINWKINKGERWALTGPNGAGKSTLLSLILADNAHGYLNELYLFDKKRGSGESIWEIKKKIGYVSPELHLFFQRGSSHAETVSNDTGVFDLGDFSQPKVSCFEAIASGFHEQIGSSAKITQLQAKKVDQWMELLGIAGLKKENYNKLSSGTQRLVLLARALVKDAPLLILDEPCQGLDRPQTEIFKSIVDFICINFNKTLVYVSHYPEDIPSCVNRFLVLENGKAKDQFEA